MHRVRAARLELSMNFFTSILSFANKEMETPKVVAFFQGFEQPKI